MGIPRAIIETGQGSLRFHVHAEEGRGRGSLTTLLVVPREPGALAEVLRDLHDPAGPVDLDARLGRLAAAAPRGTGFVVALEDLAWVYPSAEVRCRRERDGVTEDLDVPQVVRLKPGDAVDVTTTDGAVHGRVCADDLALGAAAPLTSPSTSLSNRSLRRVEWRRAVAVSAAVSGAALLVAGFFALSPSRRGGEAGTRPRTDADVAPSLEDRIVGLLMQSPSRPRAKADPASSSAVAPSPGPPADEGPGVMPETRISAVAEPVEPPGSAAVAREAALDAAPAVSGDDTPPEAAADRAHPWEFRAAGAITSSPFLSEGRILFGSRDGNLYCLDAASGGLEWTFRAGSGIGSSPCVRDDLCYVGTYAGDLLAVRVDSGKRAWRAKTGGRVVASPCLVGDAVVIASYDGSVRAFDVTSGVRKWSHATGSPVRASPEPVGDASVVVGTTGGTVYCLSAGGGKSRWSRKVGGAIHAAAVYDAEGDRVVVGTREGTLLCLAAGSGEVVWRVSLGAAVNAKPRLSRDIVLVGTGRGRLVALDRSNGHERWDAQAERGFDATPLVLGTKVLAPSSDGTLHVLDAGTGEVRDRRRLPSGVFTSPAAARGLVYLGTLRGTFHALTLP